MYTRFLTLEDSRNDTLFLRGARQTGKSTLLKELFPGCRYFDLIKGEVLDSECGVSAPTIKEYFTILQDTMIGYMIPSYKKVMKRRLILAPRFYYFDVGITNHLLRRTGMKQGSPEYGKD